MLSLWMSIAKVGVGLFNSETCDHLSSQCNTLDYLYNQSTPFGIRGSRMH